jgi:hypothetical protein
MENIKMHKVTKVDITPEALKTPEGAARVEKAAQANTDAAVACAHELRELVEALKFVTINHMGGESDDCRHVQECITSSKGALANWTARSNDFMASFTVPK